MPPRAQSQVQESDATRRLVELEMLRLLRSSSCAGQDASNCVSALDMLWVDIHERLKAGEQLHGSPAEVLAYIKSAEHGLGITLKCDVCGRDALGVASSTLGAISLAYCRDCLQHGADAKWLIEFTIGMCGPSPSDAAEWFLDGVSVHQQGADWSTHEYITVRDAYPADKWRAVCDAEQKKLENMPSPEQYTDLEDEGPF